MMDWSEHIKQLTVLIDDSDDVMMQQLRVKIHSTGRGCQWQRIRFHKR